MPATNRPFPFPLLTFIILSFSYLISMARTANKIKITLNKTGRVTSLPTDLIGKLFNILSVILALDFIRSKSFPSILSLKKLMAFRI